MNQILSVDSNNKKSSKSSKSSIHSILVVFSIILLLFGICLTIVGLYTFYRNKSSKSESDKVVTSSTTKPVISIEREDATNIRIVVTHDKELANVTYSINGEEQVEIETNDRTEVNKSISLPSGNTTITIIAEDVNGISSSREDTFEVEKPIISLEQVESSIKITVENEVGIDYISYYWDEEESAAQKFTVNNTKTETMIDVLEGIHTLNIIAVDTEGNKTTKTQKIKGDNKPELKIKTNGKIFAISASDDEGLSKIEIKLNSNETITEDIDGKDYSTTIDLEDGINKLVVTVYNKNGVTETSKVKYTKE